MDGSLNYGVVGVYMDDMVSLLWLTQAEATV